MTDFRALCAELVDALAEWRLGGGPPEDTADADLIARARTLLAEADGPAVSGDREPASVAMQPSDDAIAAPLSPAAQAVLDAFFTGDWEDEPLHANIAAALEAAADLVVPEEDAMPLNLAHRVRWDTLQSVRYQLLGIAAELEGL